MTPATTEQPELLRGLNLLFVDDSPDERELFQFRLAAYGAHVTAVASVPEAIEVLAVGATDVVLTDIGLDEYSGIDLVGVMRELRPENGAAIPAIAVTGLVEGGDAERFAAAGFDAVLIKPYDTAALVASIARLEARVAGLRALRERCAAQRQEQIALRERLARRRAALHLDRLWLVARYGVGQEREDACQALADHAAREFGESVFGCPVTAVDCVDAPTTDDNHFRYMLAMTGGTRTVLVEVIVDRKASTTTLRVDAP